MKIEEWLHFAIDSAEAAERLATGALPLGLRASAESRVQFRDTYFDTADHSLRARGIACRLRVQPQLQPALVLTIEDKTLGEGVVTRRSFESLVVSGGVFEALNGESEAARRMRALVDPAALRPVIAIEVERRIRKARAMLLARPTLEISCDTIRVEAAGIVRTLHELNVRRLNRGPPPLARLAAALRMQEGVVLPNADTLGRIFDLLSIGKSDESADALPGEPHIALIAVDGDRAAFLMQAGELLLPGSRGCGQGRAFELAERLFPVAPELRRLGEVPVRRERTRLEIWVASGERNQGVSSEVRWLPLAEVLDAVGRPGVRDRTLIAALAVFTRLEDVRRLCALPQSANGEVMQLVAAARTSTKRSGSPNKPDRFLNAELSFLDFNARVLALAEAEDHVPLLERFRYLSIFSSNLDEFFMVRVAALKRAAREAVDEEGDDGLCADEVLDLVATRLRALRPRVYRCLTELCLPALERAGIQLCSWEQLSKAEQTRLRAYFDEQLFPLLTPRALTVSPGHPFPHVPGLGLSVAAVLREPSGRRMHFSHIRVPDNLPRLIEIDGNHKLIFVEDVITANANALFPGFTLDRAYTLRVVRSLDGELNETSAATLSDAVAREVRERQFRPVIGIEVARAMPELARGLLLRELRQEGDAAAALTDRDTYEIDGPLQARDLIELADRPFPELRYPPYNPRLPIAGHESVFDTLDQRDVLVHSPYESFADSVVRFFDEAAADPAVTSIRVALYRAARDSEIVDALVRAARSGKEVIVFVELKARLDEARNLYWLEQLQLAGIPVVTGIVGYKVHGKIALVGRREGGQIRRYAHIGTGNYNEATAKHYTDLGLLTSDPAITADLADLFNALTGTSQPPRTQARRLLIAPTHMLEQFLELIEREAEHAAAGRGGRIRAKLNGLSDGDVVRALYRAARAGVRIDLIVRGLCTLRPGVRGLSENIRVVSAVGRFLEHARIYAFGTSGREEYYIGSADWRPRNLRRRVEVVTPVSAPELVARLDALLQLELADPAAWQLDSNGAYRSPKYGDILTAQEQFMRESGILTQTR